MGVFSVLFGYFAIFVRYRIYSIGDMYDIFCGGDMSLCDVGNFFAGIVLV